MFRGDALKILVAESILLMRNAWAMTASKIINGDFKSAQTYVDQAKAISPNSPEVTKAQADLKTTKEFNDAYEEAKIKMNRLSPSSNERDLRKYKAEVQKQQDQFDRKVAELKNQYGLNKVQNESLSRTVPNSKTEKLNTRNTSNSSARRTGIR